VQNKDKREKKRIYFFLLTRMFYWFYLTTPREGRRRPEGGLPPSLSLSGEVVDGPETETRSSPRFGGTLTKLKTGISGWHSVTARTKNDWLRYRNWREAPQFARGLILMSGVTPPRGPPPKSWPTRETWVRSGNATSWRERERRGAVPKSGADVSATRFP